jgi:branched-chain amino acid transport system substrate-binding protein
MKTLLWVFFGLAVISGAWYLFQGLTVPAPETGTEHAVTGTIKIGAILPLTGDRVALGLALQKTGKLAIEKINETGGISKREVEIIWEDSVCDDSAAAAATQKLIATDRVQYILGGACDGEVLASAPLVETSQVLLVSPSATSPDITVSGDYIFRLAPSDTLAGSAAARYAITGLGAKTAGVISENESSTQALRSAFKKTFEELGGEIVADETYAPGASSFRTQALKVKSSKAAVAYVIAKTPASGVAIAKQLKSERVTAKVLTTDVLMDPETALQNKTTLEGVMGMKPYFDPDTSAATAFAESFKQKYNESLAFPATMANYYSGFYLLKRAIENSGDSAEEVKNWLYTVKDWEHALGMLAFDENGDRLAEYQVFEIKSGKIQPKEIISSVPEKDSSEL